MRQCRYVKSIKVNYLEMVVNMTLQQLKYIIMVAETGTITEAASRLLYLSQVLRMQFTSLKRDEYNNI